MRVLLMSMPDTADNVDFVIRLPNLAVISLAGNLPAEHEVKVLDLVLFKPKIRRRIEETLDEFRPQLVGLSAMTFQFGTLLRIARLVRERYPEIKIAAGGYHAALMCRELTASPDLPLDFIVRAEGEETFSELVSEMEAPAPDLSRVAGLSFRQNGTWRHNPDRPLLDITRIHPPNRDARLAGGFRFLDMPADVAETSRGCPSNCKFCSITQMYGRSFRRYSVERIIADLRDIRSRGTRAVFFVDDNITYDVEHFRRICQAIVHHGLNDMLYIVQVTAAAMATNPELVTDMDQANFRYVFVGFESMLPQDLKFAKKPTNPEINRRAAAALRQHRMAIIAGFINGFPDDDKSTIRKSWHLLFKLKPDVVFSQCLTPYPRTELRREMLAAGLVTNVDDFSKYDGFTCNVRTRYISQDEIYRQQKKWAFLGNFRPSLVVGNYFLRHHFGYFITAVIKTMMVNIFNLLSARQRKFRLDM